MTDQSAAIVFPSSTARALTPGIVRRIDGEQAFPSGRRKGVRVSDERGKSLERRLHELQVEHRDLDEVVSRLAAGIEADELLIKRLKKRKLQLKDQIERLRSLLIPDLDA
ncbi:MAG: DUF465 domain-containing protein [Gammaproteobacteria bacterium]|nr:DUF465 domain-containing protein [Gammaproteobacteria bacterium]